MIKGLREEDLEVVVRISGRLGEGWDRDMVEWYEEGRSEYDDVVRYYIEELEV